MNEGMSCTVEPIRSRKAIHDIKELLENKPRDLCLFVAGIHLGLRGQDLLDLRWEQVLTGEGRVRKFITVKESKTKKHRDLAVSPRLKAALEAWQKVCIQKGELAAHRNGACEQLLFPSKGDKFQSMTIQHLHGLVNKWTAQVGIEGNFGSHTLRKTFGYHLRMQGVDLPTIMRIFGHSHPGMTLRYLGITKDEIKEACFRLNL